MGDAAADAAVHGMSPRVACRAASANCAEADAAALGAPVLPHPAEAGVAVADWRLAHVTPPADWVGSAQA